jgi:hypothetical protein
MGARSPDPDVPIESIESRQECVKATLSLRSIGVESLVLGSPTEESSISSAVR